MQSIGEAAFKANNISTLTIPEGVKEIHIGENAFFRNNITTLTVPEGVKEIGKSAFQSNKISTLSVSAKEIGEDAFRNNPICNLNIGKEVRKIGKEAFAGNSIKDLSIPNTVNSIGRDAFAQHNGKSLQPYNGHLAKISNWLTDKDCEIIGISKSSIDKYRGPRAKDLYHKGITHFNEKEYNSAEGQFAKGVDAYQDRLDDKNYKALCYAMWGVCLYEQGYYNIALDKFEEAVKLGESETARIYIGCMVHIYQDRGELQKALELAERAHELGDSDIMASLIKDQIAREKKINDLLKSGQYNKLFDWVCRYVDIDDRDFKIIDQYLVDRKDYANVVKFYKKVYDKTKNSTLVNKIASMYLTLKDYTNAAEWYSIKAQQGDKETQYKLGQVYEKANNKNLAIFWYRKAAEQKHLKAEEALAHYGVYITPQQNTSKAQASNSSSSSSSTTKNSRANRPLPFSLAYCLDGKTQNISTREIMHQDPAVGYMTFYKNKIQVDNEEYKYKETKDGIRIFQGPTLRAHGGICIPLLFVNPDYNIINLFLSVKNSAGKDVGTLRAIVYLMEVDEFNELWNQNSGINTNLFVTNSDVSHTEDVSSYSSSGGSKSYYSSNYGWKDCYFCGGDGNCPTCGGDGIMDGGFGSGSTQCPNCSSTASRKGVCSVCQGKGKVYGVKY